MAHGDLAQTAALLGAGGSLLVLVPRGRAALAGGFGLLAAAEASLGVALGPHSDLSRLDSPLRPAAPALAVLVVVRLGGALSRYPAVLPAPPLLAAPLPPPVAPGNH